MGIRGMFGAQIYAVIALVGSIALFAGLCKNDLGGNERTMWYRDVEPFYTEKGLMEAKKGKRERSRELLSMLSEIGGDVTWKVFDEAGVVLPEVSGEVLEKLGKKNPETYARVFHGEKEKFGKEEKE